MSQFKKMTAQEILDLEKIERFRAEVARLFLAHEVIYGIWKITR